MSDTYVVCEPCFKCKYTDCIVPCPVEAFREGDEMLFIDPDSCINCNACVDPCPVSAIYPDHSVPPQWNEYIALNAELSHVCPVITEKKEPLA